MTKQETEAFLEIVRQGSISGAAEKFFVTQPALSRRISILEEELGYTLFVRKKGSRNVELTEEGKAFLPIARKSLSLWQEATSVPSLIHRSLLSIAAVPSVSTYILSNVLRRYLRENRQSRLRSSHCHTIEGYGYIEKGTADLALVTHKIYSTNVETIPVYKEKMVFVAHKAAGYPGSFEAQLLDAAKELRVSWMPEYDDWHDTVFPTSAAPLVLLEQMSMLEDFLTGDSWAIVPASAARHMEKHNPDICYCNLVNGPPDRITYLIKRSDNQNRAIANFLNCLNEEIKQIEGITSFLK